jgi:hypothetical protein
VLGTTKFDGVPDTVVTVPLPSVVERKLNESADAEMVNALDATEAEIGCICAGTGAAETSENGNHAVDAVRYTYEADCPTAKVVTALLMVWPVLALTVSAVMAFVLLNVMTMPSAGAAGIVIVPVASVPAGFIISVWTPAAKV